MTGPIDRSERKEEKKDRERNRPTAVFLLFFSRSIYGLVLNKPTFESRENTAASTAICVLHVQMLFPCLSSAVVSLCFLIACTHSTMYLSIALIFLNNRFSVLLYRFFLSTFDIVQHSEPIYRGIALYKSYYYLLSLQANCHRHFRF